MVLIKQLNEIGRRIRLCFPRINNGGCCVYAVLIAKELQKLKVPVKVVIAGTDGKNDVSTAVRAIKNVTDNVEWHRQGIWFNHVGLEFTYKRKKYHYDANGVVPASNELQGYPVYPGHMKITHAELLAAVPRNWNDSFPRKDIPRILKKIQNFFNPCCWVYKQFMKTLETKMEVLGTQISAVVNAVVSTKGHRIFSQRLVGDGRSIKWGGLHVSEAQRKRIEKAVKKMYPAFTVTAYQVRTKHRSPHDGLRVRVSLAK